MRWVRLRFLMVLWVGALGVLAQAPKTLDLEAMVRSELEDFGILLKKGDLEEINRWMGTDILEAFQVLQDQRVSPERTYLAWHRLQAAVQASPDSGIMGIVKARVDDVNAGLTVHSLTTNFLFETCWETLNNTLGVVGGVMAVAGYLSAVDSMCEAWEKNEDAFVLASWKFAFGSACSVATMIAFVLPGWGVVIGVTGRR